MRPGLPLPPPRPSEPLAQRGCIEAPRRAGTSHTLVGEPGGAGGARDPFELSVFVPGHQRPSIPTLPALRPVVTWAFPPAPSTPPPQSICHSAESDERTGTPLEYHSNAPAIPIRFF